MIDFRYHLVSIVSIFLALAVGIVLGAGPLKGELGDTLTKEVAGLRQDKVDLNQRLQGARASADASDAYIAETNPTMLAGVLQDRRVALVVLPGSDAAVSDATAATLRSSGAVVVSSTSMSEDWVTSDEVPAASRDAAVAAAAGQAGVDVSDTGSAAPRDVLLASLLTVPARSPSQAVAPATAARALDALASADLIKVDTKGFELADLVVVVSGVTTQGTGDARQQAAKRWVDLVIALDARSSGALVAAEAATAGDGVSVIQAVRNDATAMKGVSTVDNAGGAMGQASVAHALREQAAGDVGQYGLGSGAEPAFAPIPAS